MALVALCHLSQSKKFNTQFVKLYTTKSQDSNLRPPNLKEAQSADRDFWTDVFSLVNDLPDTWILGCMLGWNCASASTPDAAMTKAAAKYGATRAILRTDAPWDKKLRVLNALVGNALLWSSPIWHYSKHLVRKLNPFHVTMVRRVLKFGSHTGEPWLDFEVRTRQLAKQVLHEQGLDKWGLCYLKRFWTYAGHIARGDVRANVASNAVTNTLDLDWWRRERHHRHPGRFPPTGLDRVIDAFVFPFTGQPWKIDGSPTQKGANIPRAPPQPTMSIRRPRHRNQRQMERRSGQICHAPSACQSPTSTTPPPALCPHQPLDGHVDTRGFTSLSSQPS